MLTNSKPGAFSPFAHVLPKQPVGLAFLLGNPWALLSSPSFPVAAVACDEAKTLTFIVIPAGRLPGCPKKSDVARKGGFIWCHLFMLGWLILSSLLRKRSFEWYKYKLQIGKLEDHWLGRHIPKAFGSSGSSTCCVWIFIFSRSKSCRPNGFFRTPENGQAVLTVYIKLTSSMISLH